MFSTDCRVLTVAFAVAASFSFAITPGAAHAQTEGGHEVEEAGGSRGGYSWGEESRAEETGSAPAAHHFARIHLGLGGGFSVRIIEYEELAQTRFAPAYLQLRGGYFFEGDGLVQHGFLLGIAPALVGDGGYPRGHDPFGQWTLTPSYMARFWLDGDLGDWLQLTARVGVPLALGEFFSWGVDVGVGAILEFLAGFGLYLEADISVFFATDVHPLFSLEGGLVFEYEVLP